jgi:hypothetical protein
MKAICSSKRLLTLNELRTLYLHGRNCENIKSNKFRKCVQSVHFGSLAFPSKLLRFAKTCIGHKMIASVVPTSSVRNIYRVTFEVGAERFVSLRVNIRHCYKYYVSGHYPSSCLHLKTQPCLYLDTNRTMIMSRNIIFVLMYHRHKFLDLIHHCCSILTENFIKFASANSRQNLFCCSRVLTCGRTIGTHKQTVIENVIGACCNFSLRSYKKCPRKNCREHKPKESCICK